MKKQWFVILLVSVVVAVSSLACSVSGWQQVRGSGRVVEKEFEVDGFTGVELATFGNLTIEVGDEEKLRIEAEDDLIPYFEVNVRGRTLEISTQEGVSLRPTKPVNFYLTVTDLDTIRISSSGDIQAPDLEVERFSVSISSSGDLDMGDLEADTLQVDISSSGDMTMGELQADTLQVDINSSGSLSIAGGEVERQDIDINSSGDYTARNLESVEAEANISSNGSATIRVSDYLKATLSSSGDLYYIGSPTVDARTSSSGDIEKIGE